MGLYLCVFKDDVEIDGVEIGSYEDFGFFREKVEEFVEDNKWGEKCPTLMLHSDCDGYWTVEEAKLLEEELLDIKKVFIEKANIETTVVWQKETRKLLGLKPSNLYESFIDIDGEFLIDRLINLCSISMNENEPILFQ